MYKLLAFISLFLLLILSCYKVDPLGEENSEWIGLWENEVLRLEIYENGFVDFSRNDKLFDGVVLSKIIINDKKIIINPRGLLNTRTYDIQELPTSEIVDNKIQEFIVVDNLKLIKKR